MKKQAKKEAAILELRKQFSKEKFPKYFNLIQNKLLEISPRYTSNPKKSEYIKKTM